MMHNLLEGRALFSVEKPLPKGDAAPDWITIFPTLGRIQTRDARSFDVDAAALIERFEADGLAIPIDINHSTAKPGERADAIGWITRLRVKNGALQGKVDWLEEGKKLLKARTYRYISPDFFHTPEGKTKWLRAVALVTAPALAQQRALAAAQSARSATLAAKAEDILYGVVSTPLSQTKPLPHWVVVFPALGFVETQMEDIYYINGKAICDAFVTAVRSDNDDYREFPVNVDHRPDVAIDNGEDVASAPIGFIDELHIKSGRLEAKIDWESNAAEIVQQLGLACVSPTFFSDHGGKVKRLKSISLVRRHVPFLRSRAVGNDVAPEERGYKPKAAALDTREVRLVDLSEMLRHRVAQISSIGRVSRDELLVLSMLRLEREYLLGGVTRDQSDIRQDAFRAVESDPEYEFRKLFPQGGVRLEGAAPKRQTASPSISNEEAARQGAQLAARAKQIVRDAQSDGVTISFLDAVERAEAELATTNSRGPVCRTESESSSFGGSRSGAGLARASRPEAQNGEWSVHDLLREAEKEMAQANAFGTPIDVVSAMERVQDRFGLETNPDTGGLTARAGASSETKMRTGEWSLHDLLREAGKEMAQASIGGMPIDHTTAVLRVQDRFGLETDPDSGALMARAGTGSDATMRAGEWSVHDLLREAEKEMAQANAFGTPIDIVSAMERVKERLGLRYGDDD